MCSRGLIITQFWGTNTKLMGPAVNRSAKRFKVTQICSVDVRVYIKIIADITKLYPNSETHCVKKTMAGVS